MALDTHHRTHRPHRLLLTLMAALALALAACTSGPADPEADGDWVLVSGHGPEGEIGIVQGQAPTITVNGFEVTGHSGCNQLGVAGDDEPDQWPTEFFSTMMACPEPGVMDQETAFLAAMGHVTDVHASGDDLMLSGPDTELHFERTSA